MKKREFKKMKKRLGAFEGIENEDRYAIIYFEKGSILISYWSVIAMRLKGEIYINTLKYRYSRTTMKHLRYYLNANSIAEIDEKLEKKEYKAMIV